MAARRRVPLNEGRGSVSASFAGRKEERDRDRSSQKGKPLCVGFSLSLRDILVIHDSESLSRPTTSCGSIRSMGAAKCRIAPARYGLIFRMVDMDFREFSFHALG